MGRIAIPAKGKEVEALIEFDTLREVPEFATEAEAAEWWGTHAPSERFFEVTPEVEDPDLPPPRAVSTATTVRFDADTVTRLKALARRRGKRYQTLLKEFVAERLYEEEKREGLIPS